MKTFSPKFRTWLLVVLILVMPLIVAAAPLQEGEPPAIPEAAWTFLTMLALPALAQLYKVYVERGGKPISSDAITWVIFAGGVVASFLWGGASDFLRTLVWPTLDTSDPLGLVGALLSFANALVVAGGQVAGVASVYYLLLKKLVFQYVPALTTKQMAKDIKAAAK